MALDTEVISTKIVDPWTFSFPSRRLIVAPVDFAMVDYDRIGMARSVEAERRIRGVHHPNSLFRISLMIR
jgi:hypothetical protein